MMSGLGQAKKLVLNQVNESPRTSQQGLLDGHKENVGKTLADLEDVFKGSGSGSKKQKRSLESLNRHRVNVQGALRDLDGITSLGNLEEEIDHSPPRTGPPTRESLDRHKENITAALANLKEFEEFLQEEELKEEENNTRKPEIKKPPPPVTHKGIVRNAIRELTALDATLDAMKKQEPAKSLAPTLEPELKRSSKGRQEIEEILSKKRYVEDDIDFMLAEKKEEIDKWYKWVEKHMEMVLFQVAVLTLIAAILTAFACYMFLELPKDIYGSHILREIFLIKDHIITENGFAKGPGIQAVTPLPVVIGLMYMALLYAVYLIQYPRQGKFRRIMRYVIFFVLQGYMITCFVSYVAGMCVTESRFNAYFEHDKTGLKGWPKDENHSEVLHGLNHAQDYFGCCGFRDRKEWAQVYPALYQETWPLSCCDEERSGIACYHPVKEEVTYVPPAHDGDEPKDPVTKKRLHEETCFEREQLLVNLVGSIVIILLLIYILLSTWTLLILAKISIIVTEKDITIKPAPQYIDSL